MSENKEVNWKEVATALAQRVNFAMQHLKPASGTAGLMDIKTGEFTPWREYLAEGLETIPGVKVDREMMNLFDLPRTKRNKAIQKLKAERAAKEQQ